MFFLVSITRLKVMLDLTEMQRNQLLGTIFIFCLSNFCLSSLCVFLEQLEIVVLNLN